MGQWLNLSRTSGGSGSKTSDTSEKHTDTATMELEIGSCTISNPNTDCGLVNYQTQHRVNLMHHLATVTRIISVDTSRGGKAPKCYRRSPFPVVAFGSACSSDGEEKPHVY